MQSVQNEDESFVFCFFVPPQASSRLIGLAVQHSWTSEEEWDHTPLLKIPRQFSNIIRLFNPHFVFLSFLQNSVQVRFS